MQSLTLENGGSITHDGGSLVIGELISTTDTIAANAGTKTISNIAGSNVAAKVLANAILDVGTGNLASLVVQVTL